MLRTRIAAIAIAAVAVVGTGAGYASTAHAATQETTNFTFANTAAGDNPLVLKVTDESPMPANGTAVTFDLQSFVAKASNNLNNNGADTGTTLANDVQASVLGLEAGSLTVVTTSAGVTTVTGPSVPANDFANLPVPVVPTAATPTQPVHIPLPTLVNDYNLPASDTTITLYAEHVTNNSFEVSPTNGGNALSFNKVAAIMPDLGSSVTWSNNSTTPPPVSTRSFVTGGHVVSVGRSTATLGWDIPPHNSVNGNCVVTETWGYGMTQPDGTPHYGFSCSGLGYLWGLSPHHTYTLEVLPAAAGSDYGHRIPDPNGQAGWVDVVTTN